MSKLDDLKAALQEIENVAYLCTTPTKMDAVHTLSKVYQLARGVMADNLVRPQEKRLLVKLRNSQPMGITQLQKFNHRNPEGTLIIISHLMLDNLIEVNNNMVTLTEEGEKKARQADKS